MNKMIKFKLKWYLIKKLFSLSLIFIFLALKCFIRESFYPNNDFQERLCISSKQFLINNSIEKIKINIDYLNNNYKCISTDNKILIYFGKIKQI